MAETTREQLIDLIDQLAREWDACEYDAPGGCIDIGDVIRTAGFSRVHALFDAPGVPACVVTTPGLPAKLPAVTVALNMCREANSEARLSVPMCWDLALYVKRLEDAVAAGVALPAKEQPNG
jgi:hypothetical protein